jgi:hypothetical protein
VLSILLVLLLSFSGYLVSKDCRRKRPLLLFFSV